MTDRKVWSFSQIEFELLLSVNDDLRCAVPIRDSLSACDEETVLNSLSKLVNDGVLIPQADRKTLDTFCVVRSMLEHIGKAERILKLFSSFHGGRCIYLYFETEDCTAVERNALKGGIIRMYSMRRDEFDAICEQAVENALPNKGEDVRQAVLNLDTITRNAIECLDFDSTDKAVVDSGCSLLLNVYADHPPVLRQRFVFYTVGNNDIYLICDAQGKRMVLGCREMISQLSEMFFGGKL